jgi:protein gp37
MSRINPNAPILRGVDLSKVSWAHWPWNPWLGCDKCAPECAHCYIYRELRKQKNPDTGKQRDSWGDVWLSKTWGRPFKWQRECESLGAVARVFTCSHSDFFHEKADAFRPQAWMTIKRTPNLVYLILTKRAERIAKHLPADWGDGYPNVWLGVSTGCNQTLNKMDALRKVPAALRWVSCEPLLEDISKEINLEGFSWLVAGGESGNDGAPGAGEYQWNPNGKPTPYANGWTMQREFARGGRRTMDIEWARKLQAKCAESGVVYYFKQVTATRSSQGLDALDGKVHHNFPAAPFGLPWAARPRGGE